MNKFGVVVGIMILMTGGSAVAEQQSTPASQKFQPQVTRTALPQEETRKKMPLVLLAILAAASNGKDNMMARISSNAE